MVAVAACRLTDSANMLTLTAIAADMPEANEMVVGIMAVVAQAERKMNLGAHKSGSRGGQGQGCAAWATGEPAEPGDWTQAWTGEAHRHSHRARGRSPAHHRGRAGV